MLRLFLKCGLYKLPVAVHTCSKENYLLCFLPLAQHVLPEIAQLSRILCSSLCLFFSLTLLVSLSFFLSVIFPSFLLLSRESSVLQLQEEEKDHLLCQCESDPTVVHRLPPLSRFLQERRSQAVEDYRLALSDSCITVEPAVGLCVSVTMDCV